MEENRKAIFAEAEKTQGKQDAKNKKKYDKRHRVSERKVAVGDKVMRTDLQASKKMAEGKLKPKWVGPYEVIHVERNVADLCRDDVVVKNALLKLLKKVKNGPAQKKSK